MDEIDTWLERVYAAGGDRDTLDALYDTWSEQYDQHIWTSANPYIAIAAGFVGRHISDWNAEILDAGCGTGNMAQVLHQIGYTTIDGLDASPGMLEIAERKSVYRSLHHLVLAGHIDLADESFDAVVAAGVFTQSHAPPESLDGLSKLIRSGGPIIFSLSTVALEEQGFGDALADLVRQGEWELLDASPQYQSFPFSETESHLRHQVHTYRKL